MLLLARLPCKGYCVEAMYPYVRSAIDLGPARGPRLAFVVHMAEGGGTVGYLSRPNPNDVSVHYVIEYSGRIVRMLGEDRMHTSIRTSTVRTTDDINGPYGAAAALSVLGPWARTITTLGPNHASIAVEIEGFAGHGPNAGQAAALTRLYNDLRTRYPTIRSLGHRDFAVYKACPGAYIDWASIGGHGSEEDILRGLETVPAPQLVSGVARMAVGAEVIRLHDRERIKITRDVVRDAVGPFRVPDLGILMGYLVSITGATCWVRETQANFAPDALTPHTVTLTIDGEAYTVIAAGR